MTKPKGRRRGDMMRCLLAAVFTLALPASAVAFGTIQGSGQNAEHERITRAALTELGPLTLDALAGKSGSFGAVGAPDRPLRGLITESKAHCDNGDFLDVRGYPQTPEAAETALAACRAWIFEKLDSAIEEAAPLAEPNAENMRLDCPFDGSSGSAKCKVLDNLGLALHAAQDFYAHSNWSDEPGPGATGAENPPGLGQAGATHWLNPRYPDWPFPAGLISGCFVFKPERVFCNYGGRGPLGAKHRVKHEALNKDGGPIGTTGATGPGTTPRGKINRNFERAVDAAIADTRNKWAYFEQRVATTYGARAAERILCAVKQDDPAACR